jgi:hypothetical protein
MYVTFILPLGMCTDGFYAVGFANLIVNGFKSFDSLNCTLLQRGGEPALCPYLVYILR